MSVHVDLDELLDALEWVSAGETAALDAQAYVGRLDGQIHWQGEGVDEDPPEDADDDAAYVAVPPKSELGLGRPLALSFVAEHLPSSLDKVEGYFRKRGAYAHFKSLLDAAGRLDQWYAYEQAAIEQSLTQWGAENGFLVSRKAADK